MKCLDCSLKCIGQTTTNLTLNTKNAHKHLEIITAIQDTEAAYRTLDLQKHNRYNGYIRRKEEENIKHIREIPYK
jgi:hypothetical protein